MMGLFEHSCAATLVLLLNAVVVLHAATSVRYGCNVQCSNLTTTNTLAQCEKCCKDCCFDKKFSTPACTAFFWNSKTGCHQGTGVGIPTSRGQVGEQGILMSCATIPLTCPANCAAMGIPNPGSSPSNLVAHLVDAMGNFIGIPPIVNGRYQLYIGDMVNISSPLWAVGCTGLPYPLSCSITYKFTLFNGTTFNTAGIIDIPNSPTSASIAIGGTSQNFATANAAFSLSTPANGQNQLNYKFTSSAVSGTGFTFKITIT